MPNLKRKLPISQQELLDAALAERELRLLRAEMARRSFSAFVSFTFPGYVHSAFSLAVCEALDQFLREALAGLRPILLLGAPPQHGKSQLVSRHFPPYIFGLFPELRIAAASYAADLARDMNRDVQRIMMDDLYRAVFPGIALNPRRVVTVEGQALRNSDRFDIPGHRGYYVCTGVGGPLTGKSVDIGIIDDPIKNEEEARSPTVKRSIQRWYETVFLTRLSKLSGHIIMATRWAVDDLTGIVAKNNPKARLLSFPAINGDGQPLVPELHPLDKLLETKASLSPSQWSALYQQSPVQEGGNIFQETWFRRWNLGNLPESFDEIIFSWDMAFKDTDGSDFVVGQAWGRKGPNYFLLHQVRARMGFTASKNAVRTMCAQFFGMATLIEDKANGPAVMDALREEIPGLIPVEPDGSKVARAYAVTPLFAAGNVFIPEDEIAHPWVPDYIAEMISFPAGPHDDQVDCTSQALRYLKAHGLSVWEALA
ncbi:MAG: phage terminase large subunit [Desulfovibrionaceae bacterium]|nr:phage terminase large subunit [Desulfovibrionaceae bacterium]